MGKRVFKIHKIWKRYLGTQRQQVGLNYISRVRRSPKVPNLGQRVLYLRRSYPPSFRSKLTEGQGQWAKKSEKFRNFGKVKPRRGGGGTGVGDHFGTMRHIGCLFVHRRQMGRKGGLLAKMADSLMLHCHVGQAMPVGDGAVSATRQLSSVAPTIGRLRQWDGRPAGPTDGGHWVHVRLYVILCRMYPNRQQASKQENLEKLGPGEGES